MAISIHHVSLTKKQLDTIPTTERNLLILVGHSTNELAVLAKLFHFTCGGDDKHELFERAQLVQMLLYGRLITGKLNEFWELLEAGYFRTALSRDYDSKLKPYGQEALEALKRYFGKDNLIRRVRNSHAFHYDLDQVDEAYKSLSDSEPLDVYFSRRHVNSLYAFADTIASHAMLECIYPGNTAAAFDLLAKETSKTIGLVVDTAGAIMEAIFEKHFGGNFYARGARELKIDGAPSSQVVRIPYFIDIPETA